VGVGLAGGVTRHHRRLWSSQSWASGPPLATVGGVQLLNSFDLQRLKGAWSQPLNPEK
jgi:hypothetical protein